MKISDMSRVAGLTKKLENMRRDRQSAEKNGLRVIAGDAYHIGLTPGTAAVLRTVILADLKNQEEQLLGELKSLGVSENDEPVAPTVTQFLVESVLTPHFFKSLGAADLAAQRRQGLR